MALCSDWSSRIDITVIVCASLLSQSSSGSTWIYFSISPASISFLADFYWSSREASSCLALTLIDSGIYPRSQSSSFPSSRASSLSWRESPFLELSFFYLGYLGLDRADLDSFDTDLACLFYESEPFLLEADLLSDGDLKESVPSLLLLRPPLSLLASTFYNFPWFLLAISSLSDYSFGKFYL